MNSTGKRHNRYQCNGSLRSLECKCLFFSLLCARPFIYFYMYLLSVDFTGRGVLVRSVSAESVFVSQCVIYKLASMPAFLWRNAKEKRNGNDLQLKPRE